MADFKTICMDEKAWVRFTGEGESDICVYRRCPDCGRYLKTGKITYGGKTTGWICKTHGEVTPFWTRD
jgi:hypothetical protein